MLDPLRMLDEGDALEVRLLASAARDEAPSHVRERVLGLAVAGAVSAVGGTAAAATVGTGAAKATGLLGAIAAAKWTVVAVVAGVAAAGVIEVAAGRVESAWRGAGVAKVPSAVAVRVRATSANGEGRRVAVAPAVSAAVAPIVVVPTPSVRAVAAASPGADLPKELALLDAARAALDTGDTALAIERLDRHDLDYARGQLAPDALALRIEVYAKRGDRVKVGELSRGFLARYPEHPEAPRVREIVARVVGGANP
jgi:hypothetical protein